LLSYRAAVSFCEAGTYSGPGVRSLPRRWHPLSRRCLLARRDGTIHRWMRFVVEAFPPVAPLRRGFSCNAKPALSPSLEPAPWPV
jgi:hypothetical protein